MHGGVLSALPALERTITASDGSALPVCVTKRQMWPTPRAMPESQTFKGQFINLSLALQLERFREWHAGSPVTRSTGAAHSEFLEW